MDNQISKDLEFIIAALPSFGSRYSHLVMGYAQLFGVTPMHIKAKKLRLIIEELKKLFDAQSFSLQKKIYPISHAGIGEALDICIKKNFSEHLENHNYLKKVMVGISEREGKNQSRQAEKDLRAREDNQRAGYCRDRSPNDPPGVHGVPALQKEAVPARMTPEQAQKNLMHVKDIIKGMG
jgi:hypothetical protein